MSEEDILRHNFHLPSYILNGNKSHIPVAHIVVTDCLHCNKSTNNKLCLAIGEPVYGVVHDKCAPVYTFDRYPHKQPLVFYK